MDTVFYDIANNYIVHSPATSSSIETDPSFTLKFEYHDDKSPSVPCTFRKACYEYATAACFIDSIHQQHKSERWNEIYSEIHYLTHNSITK